MEKTHSSQELSNNILQAMQIISDKRISKTQYSTTIQGIIKKCQDTSTGKYSLQYQDSIIQAYAISPSIQYSKDTLVYVFVPNGNLSEYKVILGSDKQLSVNFVESYKGQDGEYEDTGRSFIPEVNKIRLSSYRKPDPETGSPYESLITGQLDESLAAQIKNANHLKISGIVQTNLDNAQKRKGRYGVRIVLLMKNSATGEAEQQEYYFDSNSFIGDPYNYINPTSQSVFLPFESENFVKIKSIESFVEGFPEQKDDKVAPIDIVITNFSINGSYKLSDQEIASVGVVLISKKGFTLENENDSINVIANLRVKGKPINLKEQGAKVYWFRQDARITTSSSSYMQCGGIGWDCLNPYCSFTNYTFNNSIAPTNETTFKCVIVYDNNNYSKEFEIMNPAANYDFYIESSEGTEFQYSTGHPTLTLKNKKQASGTYTYKWQVRNNQNIVKDLKRDKSRENEIGNLRAVNRIIERAVNKKAKNEEDDIYWKTKIIGRLNDIIIKDKDIIKNEKISTKNIIKIINSYKTGDDDTYKIVYDRINNDITNYQNYQQRIVNNVIYHVNLHEITNFSVFSCSVYKTENNKDSFVGSANITIKNTKAPSLGYNLVINNGDQVFLYNEAGDSLQNDSIDEPYDISDLTYSLYYNGRKIEEKDLNGAEATWKIPASNTLLQIELEKEEKSKEDYYTRKGSTLSFNVKNKYDSNNNNNDILLFLKYKKQVFQAKTYFTFNKQGQNGTNGTGIQFKIKMKNNEDAVLTHRYQKDDKGIFSFNLLNNKNIEPQIWENGEQKTLEKSEKVKYSILHNQKSNSSFYSIAPTGNNCKITNSILKKFKDIDNIKFENINNIIEAVYDNGEYKYYADLPVITIIENFVYDDNNNNYQIVYKSGTGFKYVIYKNDGTKPSYNNRLPFEIRIQKKIGEEWEDVTTYSKQGFTFNWKKYGDNIASINPTEIDKMTYKCSATPVKKIINSNTYNDALLLTIYKNNKIFAYVHIPIHFMLNRYENAALNDWNGSALDIDENGKYILTPQVGAGKKDPKKNTFTGIVMGVEQTQSNNETQTGLFGYAGGVRSIFLDANTGNAEFGLPDKGQIKINVNGSATIKSGDYPEKEGDPKKGMQIQFSNQPHIYFGSGNFTVSPEGHIHAVGGGDIAGWQISDDSLSKNTPANKEKKVQGAYVEINSSPSKRAFQAGVRDKEKDTLDINFYVTHKGYLFSKSGQIAGWKISSSSLSKTTDFSSVGMSVGGDEENSSPICFWAGIPTEKNGTILIERNFYVRRNGYLFSRSGNIGGWDISSDMLYKQQINTDNKYTAHVGISTNHVFEWQKDNIPICFWAGTSPEQIGMNFYVKRDGYLFSKYGMIGNWFIGNGGLFSDGSKASDAGAGVTTEIPTFKVDKKGNIIRSSTQETTGHITKVLSASTPDKWTYDNTKGGIYIGPDGIRFGNSFYVEPSGMYATSGKIGSIEITQGGLQTPNWRITGDGTAYFNKAIINDTDVIGSIIRTSQVSGSVGSGGFSGGGVSLGSGKPSSSSISPGVMAEGKDKTWDAYIDEKIKGFLTKDNIVKLLTGVRIDAESAGTAIGLSGITINAKDLYVTDHIDGKTLYVSDSISIGQNSVVTTADLSDYAKSSDLSALAKRVSDLENSKPTT